MVCLNFPRWSPDSKCPSKKVKKRVKNKEEGGEGEEVTGESRGDSVIFFVQNRPCLLNTLVVGKQ